MIPCIVYVNDAAELISQYMLNKIVTDIEWFGVTWIIEAKLLESYSAVIENNVLCMYAGITVSVVRLLCTYMNSLNIYLQKFQKHVLIVIGLISTQTHFNVPLHFLW